MELITFGLGFLEFFIQFFLQYHAKDPEFAVLREPIDQESHQFQTASCQEESKLHRGSKLISLIQAF